MTTKTNFSNELMAVVSDFVSANYGQNLYGQQVKVGWNNGGWPCVWSAETGNLLAGGIGGKWLDAQELPPQVANVLEKAGALIQAMNEAEWNED